MRSSKHRDSLSESLSLHWGRAVSHPRFCFNAIGRKKTRLGPRFLSELKLNKVIGIIHSIIPSVFGRSSRTTYGFDRTAFAFFSPVEFRLLCPRGQSKTNGRFSGCCPISTRQLSDPKAAALAADCLEKPRGQQPESVMLVAILRGSMMGPQGGWFGPADNRYSWKALAAMAVGGHLHTISRLRHSQLLTDGDGRITRRSDWSTEPWCSSPNGQPALPSA